MKVSRLLLQKDRLDIEKRTVITATVFVIVHSLLFGALYYVIQNYNSIAVKILIGILIVAQCILIVVNLHKIWINYKPELKEDRKKLCKIDNKLLIIIDKLNIIDDDLECIDKYLYIKRTVENENLVLKYMSRLYPYCDWTDDIIHNRRELVRLGSELYNEYTYINNKLRKFIKRLDSLDRNIEKISDKDIDKLEKDINNFINRRITG